LTSSGAAQPSSDTERRRITVMFADIAGFTSRVEQSDTEETFEVVTGCLRLLDSIARKHGGSVDKYLGDCIMAVFGLPLAIEDAPRAAVNAAIEMQRRVEEYSRELDLHPPLALHVGINTGLAISGDVSGPVLREFAVLGDPVNIASRLKDEAPPGQVFVGRETWRYTREFFAYKSLPQLKVKGKQRKIHAYRLLSRREQIHRVRGRAADSIFSEFVGRGDLMTELHSDLRELGEGRGAIHMIVGEAGLGKTRIVDEVSRAPEAASTEWLRGSGVANWQNVSYHVFAYLLRTRLGIAPGDDDPTARAKLGRLGTVLPEGAGEAQLILASMMGLRLSAEESQRVSKLEGDAMERIILGTITQLLVAVAERTPPVLVLDDLHWADASSLKLLERLLRIAHDRPVLFLLAARDGYPETTGRLLRALDQDHRDRFRLHEIEPLSHEGSRQLLRNLVQHGDVPSEFLARVEETTRGNPFFMEEVVRSLVETGVMVTGEQGVDLVGPHQAVEIPNSIHDVVMARIDGLPRALRGLLQGASVVGTSAHVAVLQAAFPDAQNLEGSLAHLERAGMLLPLPGRSRWEFKHPLIREVIYESILSSRREELHRKVSCAIEDHLSESVPGFHAMLAYHLTHGRDLERAEHHLVRAGEEATKLAAADEALRLFYDAAALYLTLNPDGGDSSRRADLESRIARAHANRGELTEAIEHDNLALEALGEHVPHSNLPRALHALPGVWSVLRLITRRRGRPLRPATEREHRVIDLMFHRARAQVTTTPAPSFVFDSFDTFRKIAAVDPRSVVGAGGMLAGMVGPLAWGGLSFSLSKRILELAEPLVDHEDEAEFFFYQVMRFTHHHQQGGWRDEYEIDAERVDAALRLGQLWDATNYLLLLGEKRVGQGRFSEAAGVAQELEKIGDLFQYDLARSSHRYVQLLLQIERGELAAALRTADAYYTEHQEKLLNLVALGNRAKVELLGGDKQAARATLAKSDQILSTERFVPPFYRLPHWRSHLLLDVLELRDARVDHRVRVPPTRRAARRALSASSKMAIRTPEVLRLDAERLWRVGRRSQARRRAEAGLDAAQRLGAVPERARLHALLARLLGEADAPPSLAGRNAVGHLQEARRLLAEHEPFAWADARWPGGDPLEVIDLPCEI
jgi:class 3 adenylate cyclase/tetratricopeptide (TPR) repeat protein